MANSFTKLTEITKYGNRSWTEIRALQKYKTETGTKTTDCGVFVCSDVQFLAASLDRIVDDDILVVVECPYSVKDDWITKETGFFLVYTLKDIKIMRICRDKVFIAKMKAMLTNFFTNIFDQKFRNISFIEVIRSTVLRLSWGVAGCRCVCLG